MSKQTLENRVNQGIERHQFTLDDYQEYPDMHLRCWCGGALLVDYQQFGPGEMKRRIATFVSRHEKCPVPRQVDLDASLETGIARAKARNYAAKGKL
jgi:hypothetical protein